MTLDNRINAFVLLGNFLDQFSGKEIRQENNPLNSLYHNDIEELIKIVHIHNPWFTEPNVRNAIGSISLSLNPELMVDWVSPYLADLKKIKEPKRIAVIMAGNIPMVGFHDMLCVLISGNTFIGKLSSDY